MKANSYVMTEAQVESLALERYNNASQILVIDDTYLKVLVVAAQAKLGKSLRGRVNKDAQLAVLTEVNERFYPAVLRGVTTHDIAIEPGLDAKEQTRRSLERNSRSAFARSAKSTLFTYVNGGGDIRALDSNVVTKHALRKAMAPPEPTDKTARQISRSKDALFRALKRQVAADVDTAAETIDTIISTLQAMLIDIGVEPEDHTETVARRSRVAPDRGPMRTRVGVPMLNRGA